MALVDVVLPPKQLTFIYQMHCLYLARYAPPIFFFFLFSFYAINDVKSNGNFSSLVFRYTYLRVEYSQKLVGASIFVTGPLKYFLLKKKKKKRERKLGGDSESLDWQKCQYASAHESKSSVLVFFLHYILYK